MGTTSRYFFKMHSVYLKSYFHNVKINPIIFLITFDESLLGKKAHPEAYNVFYVLKELSHQC